MRMRSITKKRFKIKKELKLVKCKAGRKSPKNKKKTQRKRNQKSTKSWLKEKNNSLSLKSIKSKYDRVSKERIADRNLEVATP